MCGARCFDENRKMLFQGWKESVDWLTQASTGVDVVLDKIIPEE